MSTQTVKLIAKTALSPDTSDFCFELQSGSFSGLEAGAHVDVHLQGGLVRQYSIWKWNAEATQLHVAVKREDTGRGGSRAMHDLPEGAVLELGGPRNHFKLEAGTGPVTLIAGGIGATPIYAMAQALQAAGRPFTVQYLVRSRDFAAMDTAFAALDLGAAYHLHCDDTDGLFDMQAAMRAVPEGGDVYTCGPEPMLNAVLEAGKLLRGGTVRFERFAAASDQDDAPREGFEIQVQSSGAVYQVGEDQTILQVLQDNGIAVDFGCSEGLCGSCMVDVVEGEVDHRDGILTPEEQASNEFLCTCVSRAKSDRLVLML
jgi:vanillate O-demethylase ferredoxin subunit